MSVEFRCPITPLFFVRHVGMFLLDSQDSQPPLKGYKTSPMNGAGQPPASTFRRFPRRVRRSSLVAMISSSLALSFVVAHSQFKADKMVTG